MADLVRAADRPDMQATFDHNDHCTTEGWATWAAFCRGKGMRYWWHRIHGHQWVTYHDANPGYRHCTCGRREHWYSSGHHRFGGYDRWVWQQVYSKEADRG